MIFQPHRESTSAEEAAVSKRFIIGWRSNAGLREEDVAPPFEWWISNRRPSERGEELSFCGVVNVASQFVAEEIIKRHFPDARISFCKAPPEWWPSNGGHERVS